MDPFVIVIFGATGDLAYNKLLPALFSLYKQNKLSKEFFIVGFARRDITDDEYRRTLAFQLDLRYKDEYWSEFSKRIFYQQGMFDQTEAYEALAGKLKDFDRQVGSSITRLFYLATPPDNYETILNFLNKTKFSQGSAKLAIEKPFGRDLNTARNLDKKLVEVFKEKQIFRVDHYLGKETVQNLLAFRFGNSIFEPIWNKDYIDYVQITLAEKKGIGNRGKFFDGIGILRDVGQNHLLQLLAAVVMEQPRHFTEESVRDARFKAIKAIRPLSQSDVAKYLVRGQYKGYRQEINVQPDSQTETFVAMKLFVDNDRFSHIPFYLRAGKKMVKDQVDIKIVFRQTCSVFFKDVGCPEIGNVLSINIQPDEGISLRLVAKTPGTKLSLGSADMDFLYSQEFGDKGAPAYEKVLLDIISGDQMLFNRSDELESSWQLISTILNTWEKDKQHKLSLYEGGTWGPEQAKALIEKDGRKWL